MKKRLEFSRNFFCKSVEYWRNVVWSDECILKVYNPNNRTRYWSRPTDAYQLPLSITTTQTKKYGGGAIMIWACFSYYGKGKLVFIDDTINALRYQRVLSENLIESVNMMGLDSFIFQDSAPAHSSKLLMQFFNENNIDMLPHPPQSPDLNSIENLWAYISREIIKKNPKTVNQLKNEIVNIWDGLDIEELRKLANSMPSRLEQVINSGGRHTEY